MSRSRRKSPAGGIAVARSDKPGKQQASRALRVAERAALTAGGEIPDRRSVSNPYTWPKDGKRWFGARLAAEAPSIVRK